MALFRSILIAVFAAMVIYTTAVILRDGWGLIPVFVGDLMSVGWRGQFNLDFSGYLILSALWLGWRSGFSAKGIALGLIAGLSGMLVFAPVLLVLSVQAKGDMRRLILGVHAAPQGPRGII